MKTNVKIYISEPQPRRKRSRLGIVSGFFNSKVDLTHSPPARKPQAQMFRSLLGSNFLSSQNLACHSPLLLQMTSRGEIYNHSSILICYAPSDQGFNVESHTCNQEQLSQVTYSNTQEQAGSVMGSSESWNIQHKNMST